MRLEQFGLLHQRCMQIPTCTENGTGKVGKKSGKSKRFLNTFKLLLYNEMEFGTPGYTVLTNKYMSKYYVSSFPRINVLNHILV